MPYVIHNNCSRIAIEAFQKKMHMARTCVITDNSKRCMKFVNSKRDEKWYTYAKLTYELEATKIAIYYLSTFFFDLYVLC